MYRGVAHWIEYKINFILRLVVFKKRKKPTVRKEQKKNPVLGWDTASGGENHDARKKKIQPPKRPEHQEESQVRLGPRKQRKEGLRGNAQQRL